MVFIGFARLRADEDRCPHLPAGEIRLGWKFLDRRQFVLGQEPGQLSLMAEGLLVDRRGFLVGCGWDGAHEPKRSPLERIAGQPLTLSPAILVGTEDTGEKRHQDKNGLNRESQTRPFHWAFP